MTVCARASAEEEGHTSSSPIDPSFGAGLVYRSIAIPSNIDVCVPVGKYCPMVGSLASNSAHVDGFGALLRTNILKGGPLRLGTEVDLGGTTSGIDGTYAMSPVRISTFFFTNVAVSLGLAMSFDRVSLRAEALAGVSIMKADTSLRTDDGLPLGVMSTNAYAEGRGTVAYFVSPRIAVSAYGGAGWNQIWHAGFGVGFCFDPIDKNR